MSDIADALRKQLRQQMNEYADAVARGDAHSYESYREMVGTITGLALAERMLIDLQKQMENDDDE